MFASPSRLSVQNVINFSRNNSFLRLYSTVDVIFGIFDNQFNLEKQAGTRDVSEIDLIEHKNESIEFHKQLIRHPDTPLKFKLTARKQLDHLLGLDQLSIVDPEETAAKIRKFVAAADAVTGGIDLVEARKMLLRRKKSANLTIC